MNFFKSISFGLLTLVMVSFLMTSCGKESISEQTNIEQVANDDVSIASIMVLPKGYDQNLSEQEIQEHLSNLSETERTKLIENHRIASYLVEMDKFDEVNEAMDYGQTFTEVNLSDFLSASELAKLNGYSLELEPDVIDERGNWWSWTVIWEGYVCGGSYCQCYYKYYRRECNVWFGSNYYEYATINPCSGAALPSGGWC